VAASSWVLVWGAFKKILGSRCRIVASRFATSLFSPTRLEDGNRLRWSF